MSRQRAFTLIETCIVLAIIGILAAFALPQYYKYQAKSKIVASLAELTYLKGGWESALNDSGDLPTLQSIGISIQTTQNCSFTVVKRSSSLAGIACDLVNPPYLLSGGQLVILRSAAGSWTCSVNDAVSDEYIPNGCSRNS